MDKKTNFENFTNLYELSKTLRFELKPVGKTEELLKENRVFKKDEIIKSSYDKIKPYLDDLHRKFIEESLEKVNLDYSEIEEIFLEQSQKVKKDITKKERENFDKIKGKLRKKIVQGFNEIGKNWKSDFEQISYTDAKGKEKNLKIKGEGYKILLSDTNLDILAEIFSEEKEGDKVSIQDINGKNQNLFKSFKGFTTYFTNFNHSRENFYKDDGKAGRIATRLIDENLLFFLKNKKSFDEKYKDTEIAKKLKEKIKNLDEVFSLSYYNNCLTGEQIQKYNEMIGDLNSVINLEKQAQYSKYKQNKKQNDDIKVVFKKSDFPLFKELYKQILSEKDVEEKFIEIEDFVDVKKYLFGGKTVDGRDVPGLLTINDEKHQISQDLITDFVEKYENYSLDQVYLSKMSLNTLSAKMFGSGERHLIQDYLLEKIGKKNNNGRKDLPDFVKLSEIQKAIFQAQEDADEKQLFKKDFDTIGEENSFVKFMKIFQSEFENLIDENKQAETAVKEKIATIEKLDDNKEKKEEQIDIIKRYLDSSLNVFRMMKYFALEKGKENIEGEYEIDNHFYNTFRLFYGDNQIIQYYNEFRNYLTKKPYSTDKIKLNFENGTLLDGWDKNKEPDNFGTLLEKDGKYFLAVQVYGKPNIFYKKKGSSVVDIVEAYKLEKGEESYRKIDYKFLPDPKKMLPKVCFAKSNLELFNPSKKILDIKEKESFKTGEKFVQKDFEAIVDFYKESLKKYPDWKVFDFCFSPTSSYKNLADFYREVEIGSYKLNFRDISTRYIAHQLEQGDIYLFEIYNRDFAEKKSGTPNLHTLYFKGLFEKNNLDNVVLKLNGQAEIFHRPASLQARNTRRTVKENAHDIVEKQRYTQDKIFFHCPIKLNFAKHETGINHKILNYLVDNKSVNIIGIDRGEKHLAYYSVINQKGNILKDENGELVKGSLNQIFDVSYYDLLVKREKERKDARGSWKTIGNIKELKNGYISQVVHKLAELVIKHNAIIVFEDLNMGFKRGRQKIERQVYQKLEKALIEKLNYLTFKDRKFGENGHYLSAYQLTAPFESFEKLGKQTGIIFYTDPSYTSSTCPACGFRRDLYIKYTNLEKAKESIKELDSIYFEDDRFIFEYKGKKLYSDRDRKKNQRDPKNNNERTTVDNNITKNLKELFEEFAISYTEGQNLIQYIQDKHEKKLYQEVFANLDSILRIRNATIGDNSRDGDFIACPCCEFDTRKENAIGIENGDDNGAYNIARKGLIILEKIYQWGRYSDKEKSKVKGPDLYVSKNDWDDLLAGKNLSLESLLGKYY